MQTKVTIQRALGRLRDWWRTAVAEDDMLTFAGSGLLPIGRGMARCFRCSGGIGFVKVCEEEGVS